MGKLPTLLTFHVTRFYVLVVAGAVVAVAAAADVSASGVAAALLLLLSLCAPTNYFKDWFKNHEEAITDMSTERAW